ncbi:MAG: enoyl-CoA hydratase/isomerase family protein [Allosphingosinicella sp.]
MTAENGGFRVDRSEGVLTLTFDRPESGNAIPREWTTSLIELFESVNGDASVRCLLVRGEGPHFSLGGDVRGFAADLDRPAEERQADFHRRLGLVSRLVTAFLNIEVPIVVACQGGSAGAGLMYPLGADYVVGEPGSFLVFAHQRLALTPDGGVSYLLPRVVGERVARQLVLTSARVEADEALRLGILSRIVDPAELDEEARKQARRFASGPAQAARAAKKLLKASLDASLADQMDAERDGIAASVGHPDFAEGVRAFVEKRQPHFPSVSGDDE